MPKISVAGDLASCGHTHTGSSVVTVEGNGVSRVEVDTAGGLIIGPGSQNVYVEGFKVSLIGDAITTHGKTPHSSALTSLGLSLNTTTTAGTGFAGDTISTGEAPKPNIVTEGWTSNYGAGTIELHTSGQPSFPPADMNQAYRACNIIQGNTAPLIPPAPPQLRYSYSVANRGANTSQPFSVGFWRFSDGINAPNQAILTLASQPYYPTSILEDEDRVPGLSPGETYTGSFVWNGIYLANSSYAFGIYADIYGEATEPDEKNSAPTIYVVVDRECL